MASCKNCGVEIKEETDFCPNCDNGVNDVTDKQQSTIIDKGGFGWGLLGCFMPIVGVILYLVWSDERPKTARAVGIGAITCVAIVIVCYLLIMLVGMIVNPYGNVVV